MARKARRRSKQARRNSRPDANRHFDLQKVAWRCCRLNQILLGSVEFLSYLLFAPSLEIVISFALWFNWHLWIGWLTRRNDRSINYCWISAVVMKIYKLPLLESLPWVCSQPDHGYSSRGWWHQNGFPDGIRNHDRISGGWADSHMHCYCSRCSVDRAVRITAGHSCGHRKSPPRFAKSCKPL